MSKLYKYSLILILGCFALYGLLLIWKLLIAVIGILLGLSAIIYVSYIIGKHKTGRKKVSC